MTILGSPPLSQLLPPAQALSIPLDAYATGQFAPCERKANPVWQTDKSWMIGSCYRYIDSD